MAIIRFRRGTSTPSGLQNGEPAFNTNANKLYIGNSGSTIPLNVDISAGSVSELPSAGNEGDIFLCNNSSIFYRDNGSSWDCYGPIFRFHTMPALTSFTWVNQTTATAVETYGGIYMSSTSDSGVSCNALTMSAPATPWTLTVGVFPNIRAVNYAQCGLLFRESSSGKMARFSLYTNGGYFGVASSKLNSPTSQSGDYSTGYNQLGSHGGMVWMKILDDGTNRQCWLSSDNISYSLFHTVGRTDFITANQLGIFVDPCSSSSIVFAHFLSWQLS